MSEAVIVLLGDVHLGDTTPIELDGPVLEVLRNADLVVANQEGPITQATAFDPSKCCLRSVPETAERLRRWRIDVVSLANNHMFDYGWEGFDETRRCLDAAGIQCLGAGRNLHEASRPLLIKVGGLRIGLLAYSWALVQTACATEDTFGCAPVDEELMLRQVSQLSTQADTVIVLPHWGYCEYRFPPPQQVSLAGRLIQAGATAIIGHHSHVVQGSVLSGGRLIAYSLGNFAFAQYRHRGRAVPMTQDNRNGVMLRLRLGSAGVLDYEFIPTGLHNDNMIRLDRRAQRKAALLACSAPLRQGDYGRHWRRYVRLRMLRRLLYWANVMHWRDIHRETLHGAWLMLKSIVTSGTHVSRE